MGRLAELRELILGGGARPSAAGRPGQRPRPGGSAVGPGVETTGGLDVGQRLDARHVTSLEVLAAPRAERPVESHEATAVRADTVEPCPAGWTDDPLVVDPAATSGTALDGFDFGEERLLGEIALLDLADLPLPPNDPAADDRQP